MPNQSEMTLPVRGMHCRSCEILVEGALKEIPGVTRAKADWGNGTVLVAGTADAAAVIRAVESCGYRVGAGDDRPLISNDRAVWGAAAAGLAAVFTGYVALGYVPNFSAHLGGASGFGGALLVGLAAGFSSCIALVGGIVLSVGARWAAAHPEAGAAKKASVHLLFNAGRVAGFAVGGAVLGAAGAALSPSPAVFSGLTLVAALAMLWLGVQLTGIFPRFSKNALSGKPPMAAAEGSSGKLPAGAGAFVSGALTFLLPCGFTLAMQAQAAASGHPFPGALIMALFALGTVPGLLAAGFAGSFARGKSGKFLLGVVGVVTLALGAYNASSALPLLLQKGPETKPAAATGTTVFPAAQTVDIYMTQDGNGYSPLELSVPAGSRVRWHVTSTNQYVCYTTLVARAVGVRASLKAGENVIGFDAPSGPGEIPFSCIMGMSPGRIVVK